MCKSFELCPNCGSICTEWTMHYRYYVPIRQCLECNYYYKIPKKDIYKKNPMDKRDLNKEQ